MKMRPSVFRFSIASLLFATLFAAVLVLRMMPTPDPVAQILSRATDPSTAARQLPGFTRSYAAYDCNASICNSGFEECFWHPERANSLVLCIEFYDRIDCPRMVEVFLSVLQCSRALNRPGYLEAEVPEKYLADFTSLSDDLGELDSLYYEQLGKLPRMGDYEEPGIKSSINYYWKTYPEDFH